MSVCSLADYRARPHTTMIDFEQVMVPDLTESYTAYQAALKHQLAQPEECALTFYLLNAAMAELSQKLSSNQPLAPLEQVILDKYYEAMADIGLRCFFYVLLICTRETRHVTENGKMLNACDPTGAMPFWKSIKGSGSDGAVQKFLKSPPKIGIKAYTQHMVDCFQLGSHSGGYAGPKWAAVARPLRDYVHGAITLEMLLDTVWTLAHNGGPIFNKGMLFYHYNSTELVKILDVQRAGMVPNMVAHADSKFVQPSHGELMVEVRKVIPEFGKAPVDWQKVQELGAVGKYAKVPPKPATPKVKPVMDPNLLQIMPGTFVKKVSRKEVKV